MKAAFLPAAALAVAAFAFPGVAAPARHAAHRAARPTHDWSRNVVATAEGGFRMGNPSAKVKLVEYGSLTCPHCGHFAREGVPILVAKYVRTGKVSYEYRNMVLNGLDITAAILARCAGPSGFFKVVDSLYATQDSWMKKAEAASEEEKARIAGLPQPDRLRAIAALSGLGPYGARGGVTPQREQACFADPAALDRLARMYEAAGKQGVDGTPSFFINGVQANVGTWPALEPLIIKAGG